MTGKAVMAVFLSCFMTAAVWGGQKLAATSDTYSMDPAHSWIGFSIQHLTINFVKGHFKDVSGSIVYNEADIAKSSVTVSIKTASIDTGVEKRDEHLRSADFFDVAKFPEMTFTSQRIEKKGNTLHCVGTMTLHGVSKEVTIPFKILGKLTDPKGGARIGVEGAFKINRQDFGVSWSKDLPSGGLAVGNEVEITLNFEAARK